VRSSLLPFVAALAGAAFSAALLRKGVVMGPDSWAYWEGSVSLVQMRQYAYFGGEPIATFPPLFPWTLAAFQGALGVSVRTLTLALGVMVAAASFAWLTLFGALSGRRDVASFHDVLATVYVPATLAVHAQVLMSEPLWLVLLPLFLLTVLAPARQGSPLLYLMRAAAAWLTLAALLLCRNATVALLPAAFLLLARMDPGRRLVLRLATASAITAAALLPWYWVRHSLGQLAYHPLGTARDSVLYHAQQALGGLANAFGPDRLGIGAILLGATAVLLSWPALGRRGREPGWALAGFAVFGLAGMVAVFSVTHVGVGEPLRGRYVVFAALLLALAAMAAGASAPTGRRERALRALGVALTAVALYRVGVKSWLAGREQPVQALNVTIAASYWSGPPKQDGSFLLVAPPTYPWLQRSGLH
jgi:hypothetical protein